MDEDLPSLFAGDLGDDTDFWGNNLNDGMQDPLDLFNEKTDHATNNQDSYQNAAPTAAGTQAVESAASSAAPASAAPLLQQASQSFAPSAMDNANTGFAGPSVGFNPPTAFPRLQQTHLGRFTHPAQIPESPFQFGQPTTLDPRPQFPRFNQLHTSPPAASAANPTQQTPSQTPARSEGNHTSSFARNDNGNNAPINVAQRHINYQPGLQVIDRALLLEDPEDDEPTFPEPGIGQDVQIVGPQGIEGIVLTLAQPLYPNEKMCGSRLADTFEDPYEVPEPTLDQHQSLRGYSFTVFRGTGVARKHFTPAMREGTFVGYFRDRAEQYPLGSTGRKIYYKMTTLEFDLTFGFTNFQYQSDGYRNHFLQHQVAQIGRMPPDAGPRLQTLLQGLARLRLDNRIQLMLIDEDHDNSDRRSGDLCTQTRDELCVLILKGEPFVEYKGAEHEQWQQQVLRNVKRLLLARVGFARKTYLLTMAMVIWPFEVFHTNSIALNEFFLVNQRYLFGVMTDERTLVKNQVAHRQPYQEQLNRGATVIV